MTPWHTCYPFIPFDVYYNSHPVVIVQRRVWQVATRFDLTLICVLPKQHTLIHWQRNTLAHTLRNIRRTR